MVVRFHVFRFFWLQIMNNLLQLDNTLFLVFMTPCCPRCLWLWRMRKSRWRSCSNARQFYMIWILWKLYDLRHLGRGIIVFANYPTSSCQCPWKSFRFFIFRIFLDNFLSGLCLSSFVLGQNLGQTIKFSEKLNAPIILSKDKNADQLGQDSLGQRSNKCSN